MGLFSVLTFPMGFPAQTQAWNGSQSHLVQLALILLLAILAGFLFHRLLRLQGRLKELSRHESDMQERFRQVFEHTSDAVFGIRVGEKGKLHLDEINPSGCQLLACETRSAKELVLDRLLSDSAVQAMEASVSQCLKQQQILSVKLHLEGRNGSREVSGILVPLTELPPSSPRVMAFLQDETQKRAEEEHLRQNLKLESLALMAGGIAHDFNNLFQAALGNLEVLKWKTQSPNSSDPLLERAMGAIQQAAQLSGTLLSFSGKNLSAQEWMDLQEIVEARLSILKDYLLPEASMEVNLHGQWPRVLGDPSQVAEVVQAIVTNAIEAAGEHGRIQIRLLLPPLDQEEGLWILPPPESWVGLEVTDNGPGIPAHLQFHVFDPFFSTKKMGRGLGLPATMGILKAHSAGLQLRSSPDSGTRIRILFPTHPNPTILDTTPDAPVHAVGQCILVVDDDETVRDIMTQLITQVLGLPVLQAQDGIEAVDLMNQRGDEVALVLIDAVMPRLGGVEAFAQIRSKRPEIPGILCSGFNDSSSQELAQSHGFHRFLKKPFLMQDLKSAIEAGLDKRG